MLEPRGEINTTVPLGPIQGGPTQKVYRIGGLFPLGPTLSGPIIVPARSWAAPLVEVIRRGPAIESFRRVSIFNKILPVERYVFPLAPTQYRFDPQRSDSSGTVV